MLKAYDGRPVTTLGVADVTIKAGTKSCICTCFEVPAGQTIVFGQDAIRQSQLLSINEANMINVNTIDITVDPQVAPVALPPKRHAFSLWNEIEAELERLQQADVIEPVRQATSWLSPLVPVRKANGTLRLCVDYRRLNKAIVRKQHMLPTLDEITATLEGAKVFSVLDAESGFHQVPLDIESRHYTNFTTPRGMYRFKRLPFGVACAPEIFQRVVDDILQGLDGVIIYIDDILVSGKDQQEHDRRMQRVLQRLKDINLKLNWPKCQIRKARVKYLGHFLTDDGLLPDADKLRAIQDMPCQKSTTDVRRFLRMATYLGKFIPHLSQVTAPLRQLAKADLLGCTKELESAFGIAKEGVTTAFQKLAYFRPFPAVRTAISCDAIPLGLGTML